MLYFIEANKTGSKKLSGGIRDMFRLIPTSKIDQAMTERGVTQVDIAEALGISRVWVNNIVSGKKSPGRNVAKQISEFLGGDIPDFFIVQDASQRTRVEDN